MERTFDRSLLFDERSRNFGIADVLTRVEPKKRYWSPGTVLDQGREGACVGFGWTTEILASPMPFKTDADHGNIYALGIYNRAKQIDQYPGENYEGTSVIAGAKVLLERGYMTEYRWAFNVEQVRDAVISEGPVVLGINWNEEMYETRPSGLVTIGGKNVGGHCITLTGYNPRARLKGERGYHEVFQWKNSWGLNYGINGFGYIKIEDLATLLKDDGEACIPMQRQKVKALYL